jgi:hypothetical protein
MTGRPVALNLAVFVIFFIVLTVSLRIFLAIPFGRAFLFGASVTLASFVTTFLLMNILSSRLR